MIFIQLILVLLFTIHVGFIWTARHFDLNISPDLEDLSGVNYGNEYSDDPEDTHCSTSRNTFSRNKRLRTGTSTSKNSKKIRQNYYNVIWPIDPVIEDNMVDFLRQWEKILLAKGRNCVWEKFNELSKKVAKDICTEIWKIQLKEIPEIKVENGIPDCDPGLIPGPSGHKSNYRHYRGHIQYLDEMGEKEFYIDLVRCNCAILKWMMFSSTHKTAPNSKRFFFIHKYADTMYYIFTSYGCKKDRIVKIVNIREISVVKP